MSMKILRIAAETKRYLNSFSWICLVSYGRNLALLGWFIPLLSRYLWGFIVIPATAGRWGASSDAAAHGIYVQPGSASACRDQTKAPNLNLLGNKNKLLQRIYIYMCIHIIYMCVYVYFHKICTANSTLNCFTLEPKYTYNTVVVWQLCGGVNFNSICIYVYIIT